MDKGTREIVKGMVAESNVRVRKSREQMMAKAKSLGFDKGRAAKIGKTGRHEMSIPQEAFMRVVAKEGPEVLTPAAEGYWNDMKRKHPYIHDGHDVRARFPEHAATSVYRDGKWWRKDAQGAWVEEPPTRRDWSKEGAPMLMLNS